MNYYHIDKQQLTIISGPHTERSTYVKKLTHCGNPECLDLSAYDLVPEILPTLQEGNVYDYDSKTVAVDGVTIGQKAAPVYVPTQVTMRQARLQLLALGVLDTVNSAVSGMGAAAQIEWEYASTVERNNSLTVAMAALLEWTEAQTDAYFTAASKL